MAVGLNALFDKRGRALARARFRAWWEGESFDPEAAAAEIEAKLAAEAANDAEGHEEELFEPPALELPPRLLALAAIWGEGRVRPGDAGAEALEPQRVGVGADGVLAFLGPGLAAPVAALASVHPGRIEVYEWREETLEALREGVARAGLEERVSVTAFDIEAHAFPANHFDALLSIDDFAYCGYPPQLAQRIAKGLKPGACAAIEVYVGSSREAAAPAFASAFAEPQIRSHEELQKVFASTGLSLEADDDLAEDTLKLAREGFERLSDALADAAALDVAVARELAWEAQSWRTRMTLLTQRRLMRRRFVLRKPAEAMAEAADQAENANAPAG